MLRELKPIRQSMMNNNRKKIVVSCIATIFLVLLYCLIFSFSEQDGETSGGLSQKVSKKCVEIVDEVTNRNWTKQMKESLAEYFEHPIRKLAHFSEYAVMGILVFIIWCPWLGLPEKMNPEAKNKGLFAFWQRNRIKIIVMIWVFLSAVFDEIHQTFTPGRDGNFLDVLLDTTGGCFGLVVCLLCAKLTKRLRRKKD